MHSAYASKDQQANEWITHTWKKYIPPWTRLPANPAITMIKKNPFNNPRSIELCTRKTKLGKSNAIFSSVVKEKGVKLNSSKIASFRWNTKEFYADSTSQLFPKTNLSYLWTLGEPPNFDSICDWSVSTSYSDDVVRRPLRQNPDIHESRDKYL